MVEWTSVKPSSGRFRPRVRTSGQLLNRFLRSTMSIESLWDLFFCLRLEALSGRRGGLK